MTHAMRIMSFNIWGCARGIDQVAAVINAQSPDIALLQEVHNGMPAIFVSDGRDQAAELAARTGLTYYRWGKQRDYRTFGGRGWVWGAEGNAILSKNPLGPVILHPVDSPEQSNTYLQVSLQYYGITHQLICMHWEREGKWVPNRDKAIELVGSFPSDTPLIIAGDLNGTPNDADMLPFLGLPGLVDASAALSSADPCAKFGTWMDGRIDYILYRGPYQLRSAFARCDPAHPSDHPAVLTDLDFPTTPSLPRLSVSVQPSSIPLGRQVQVTVTARDAATQVPISGTVSIDGRDVGVTGAPFFYTFQVKRIIRYDPDTGARIQETIRPEGQVRAPGYESEGVFFRFTPVA